MAMHVRRKRLIVLVILPAALVFAPAARAHLLVTEVGYDTVDETSPTSEFVEVLNPDAGATSLADVWLVGDEDAYPYLVNGPVSGISLNNFIYRFPAIMLGPGETAVVCQDSDAFLAEHFPGTGLAGFLDQPGGQMLLEVTQDGPGDGVPDMIPWGSNPAGTLSMANNGECVGLVTWDGAGDRVADLDWVCWLTTNAIPNKDVDYPLGIDGPDADFDPTFFVEDRANGIAAPDAPQGSSIHRTSVAETGEVTTGGNGAGGHDETSEDWSTWVIGDISPGRVEFAIVAVPIGSPGATAELALGPGAPSPFRREVRLAFVMPRAGHARLSIHDLQGRSIATLVDGPADAGTHRVTWDGRDRAGREAQTGIYFARFECDGQVRSRRLSRVRE
jgi:flagellar hook capping protein FlgD